MSVIMFTASENFKNALEAHAQKLDVSRADFIRQTLGKTIKYDFSNEPARKSRKSKYDSPEERKAAAKQQAAEYRRQNRELLQRLRSAERIEDIQALQDSLKGRKPSKSTK